MTKREGKKYRNAPFNPVLKKKKEKEYLSKVKTLKQYEKIKKSLQLEEQEAAAAKAVAGQNLNREQVLPVKKTVTKKNPFVKQLSKFKEEENKKKAELERRAQEQREREKKIEVNKKERAIRGKLLQVGRPGQPRLTEKLAAMMRDYKKNLKP
jgi:hypothetical protein